MSSFLSSEKRLQAALDQSMGPCSWECKTKAITHLSAS